MGLPVPYNQVTSLAWGAMCFHYGGCAQKHVTCCNVSSKGHFPFPHSGERPRLVSFHIFNGHISTSFSFCVAIISSTEAWQRGSLLNVLFHWAVQVSLSLLRDGLFGPQFALLCLQPALWGHMSMGGGEDNRWRALQPWRPSRKS